MDTTTLETAHGRPGETPHRVRDGRTLCGAHVYGRPRTALLFCPQPVCAKCEELYQKEKAWSE